VIPTVSGAATFKAELSTNVIRQVENLAGFSQEKLTRLDPIRLLLAVLMDAGNFQLTGAGHLNHDPITKRYI
jgi:hypothetical protein